MHEFELGVWKAIFTHLIRILETSPNNLIDRLDEKYSYARCFTCKSLTGGSSSFRRVPGFGASTIRSFATNVSEMKKLAARDFEDILQV